VCAHGGEIAEAAGEATVPGRGSGVPVATEMSTFQGKVSGYKDIAALRRAQDGAVVADAKAYRAAGASGAIAKGTDELEFAAGHIFEDTVEKVRLSAIVARI
jgi:hypothetical protein